MQRVINPVEKNIRAVPQALIVIPAGQSTLVLKDISTNFNGEYAGRYIQNVGANACYYGIGHDTDKTNFNGIMAGASAVDANNYGPGAQFNASNFGQAVYVYSVSGTTIAVTLLMRHDNTTGAGGILNQSL